MDSSFKDYLKTVEELQAQENKEKYGELPDNLKAEEEAGENENKTLVDSSLYDTETQTGENKSALNMNKNQGINKPFLNKKKKIIKRIRKGSEEKKTTNICDLVKNPTYLLNAFVGGIIYFVCVYDYYGSLFGIEALNGSIYFNSIFLAAADVIGCLLIKPVLKHYKRKSSTSILFFIICIISLGFLFVQVPEYCIQNMEIMCWQKLYQAISIGLMKVLILIAFGISYLYMNEIFPSEIRGIGVGVCVVIGRFGGILAPFISNLLINYDIYPQISFGAVSFIAIFIVMLGEETFGKGLAEKNEEDEKSSSFSSRNKYEENEEEHERKETYTQEEIAKLKISLQQVHSEQYTGKGKGTLDEIQENLNQEENTPIEENVYEDKIDQRSNSNFENHDYQMEQEKSESQSNSYQTPHEV